MYTAPKCLSRRYDILDNLVKDLTASMSEKDYFSTYADDVPMKMVYNLWNMIKSNPPCEGCPFNDQNPRLFKNGAFKEKVYQIYSGQLPYCPPKCATSNEEDCVPECNHALEINDGDEPTEAVDPTAADKPAEEGGPTEKAQPVGSIKSTETVKTSEVAGTSEAIATKGTVVTPKKFQITEAVATPDAVATNKPSEISEQKSNEDPVLAQLESSCKKDTVSKITALIVEQNELVHQIKRLEFREKEGTKLLQEADEMWTSMEHLYKAKVEETEQRQTILKKQLEEVHNSTKKWKNMKKDLESQIDSVDKTLKGMDEKYRHRDNDVRTIDAQISNADKRLDASKREIEVIEKTILVRKKQSDIVCETYTTKIDKIAEEMAKETRNRAQKERAEVTSITVARDELQHVWQRLLQKKLNNEYLRVQKEDFESTIAQMKETTIDCEEKCRLQEENILKEIKKYDQDIEHFMVKCSRCNESIDTHDVGSVCTDCPRCSKERACNVKGESCTIDEDKQCICVAVKEKFMANVFENMNVVLQKQIEAGAGKAVGEFVLKCLKRSKNGKVDSETKMVLKDFILTTVRKHLNLTIVGGAVKTRCEMDSEAYNKLMLCIKDTQVDSVIKEDKTTNKKSPCKRWRGTSECQCPGGPKHCLCAQKVPQKVTDPTVYSMYQGTTTPHRCCKNSGVCVSDRRKEDLVCRKMTERRSEPCKGTSCSGAWNVRDPSKPKPLSKKGSSESSQEQRSSGTSQYGSCKGSDNEQRMRYLKIRRQNEAKKCLNSCSCTDKCKPFNNTSKPYELSRVTQPIRQSSISRNVSQCNRRTDLYSKDPEKTPSVCCINNNKNCLSSNGLLQRLRTSRGDKRQKNNLNDIYASIIELIRTQYGKLAMAFDKDIMEKIYDILKENPILHVYIRKIDKYRFILKVRRENIKGYVEVAIRKTRSGNLFMDVPTDFIRSTSSYTVTKTAKQNSNDSITNKDLCEAVKLCVKTENSEYTFVDGIITTPASKYINVDFKNAPILKDLFNKKVPVVELQTKSGTCKLDITAIAMKRRFDSPCPNTCPSVFVKKKAISSPRRNEAFLQNITKKMQYEQDYFSDHTINSESNNMNSINMEQDSEDILSEKRYLKMISEFGLSNYAPHIGNKINLSKEEPNKMSAKGYFPNKLFEPPSVVKQKSSSDFVIKIDQEYDKDCCNAISKHILKNLVKISESQSEHCIHIVFDDQKKEPDKTTEHVIRADKNCKVNKSNNIHKAFRNIICQMCSANISYVHEIKRLRKVKALSELCLAQRKYCADTHNGGYLVSTLQKSIRQTDSGTYNLILDKYSKQKFINDVQHLIKNLQGFIPISGTDSGEIKIQLNQTEKTTEKEYLRVTPSGNIYLLINKETAEGFNIKKPKRKKVSKSVNTLCNTGNQNINNQSLSDCKVLCSDVIKNDCLNDKNRLFIVKKCDRTPLDEKLQSQHENKSYNDGKHKFQKWFYITDRPCLSSENKCKKMSYALKNNLRKNDKEIEVLHKRLNLEQSTIDVNNEFYWNYKKKTPTGMK